ncbi:MAG: NfeD family protein [Acidimicrobiia bacterium]|nr:NfeD family protein [Acidimicrobiia bacterium]
MRPLLDGIDWWIVLWLLAGAVTGVGELLTGTLFLLPFAVGSFAAAGAAALGADPAVALGIFVFGSGATLLWAARYGKRVNAEPPATHEGANRYIDSTGIVTTALEGREAGRVRVRGELWRALSSSGETIAEESPVRVVAVRGNALVVEPYER